MAQTIPRPQWDVTEYRAHGTSARVRCMTCGWRSDWQRNIGNHIGQVKADHRFTVHDTHRGPRQRMVAHESNRRYKRAQTPPRQ